MKTLITKIISILLFKHQILFGVVVNTTTNNITQHDSFDSIHNLAGVINLLSDVMKDTDKYDSRMLEIEAESIGPYFNASNTNIAKALSRINCDCKIPAAICLRIFDLPEKEIRLFIEKCLEITGNMKTLKNVLNFILEKLFNISTESDYKKFVANITSKDHTKREHMYSILKDLTFAGSKTWGCFANAIYDGAVRFVRIIEDIEYVLRSIELGFDGDDPFYESDDPMEDGSDYLTPEEDVVASDNEKSDAIRIHLLDRPLPITSVVLNYSLKKNDISIADVKIYRLKNQTFLPGQSFLDFIGDQILPENSKVYFQNCQFVDNIIHIGDRDLEKMKNIKGLYTISCKANDISSSIHKLRKIEALAVSGNRFYKIPEVVFEMPWLKSLCLTECSISEIPADISRLCNLKVLLISNNNLGIIPPSVLQLSGLEILSCNSNKISEIPEELANLKNLKILGVSCNLIRNIKIDLSQFPLTGLSIGSNPLEAIPKSIYSLRELKSLNIKNLRLEVFPADIPLALNNLELLIMLRNNITSLEFLSKLPKLKGLNMNCCTRLDELITDSVVFPNLSYLSLSGNKLRHIPKSVLQIKTLEVLNLSRNDLTYIGPEIGNLTMLRSLDISTNKFDWSRKSDHDSKVNPFPAPETSIENITNPSMNNAADTDFPILKELSTLSLSSCSIVEIPSWICKLENLVILNSKGNKLSKLPKDFINLSKLKFLDLCNNNFKEIPEEIKGIKGLKKLFMSNNMIQTIPGWIDELKSLTNMNLDYNHLENISDSLNLPPALRKFDCSNNKLTDFPAAVFKLKMIQFLNVGNNEIFGPFPSRIGAMLNIRKLILRKNRFFGSIPHELTLAQTLIHLDISTNRFTQLPDNIYCLFGLKSLNISNNSITRIPQSLYRLNTLEYIDLSFNRLGHIDSYIGEMKSIIHLNIHKTNTSSFPIEILNLWRLTFLDIGSNSIVKLPNNINTLTNLENFICNFNLLTEIPSTIADLKLLTTLYICGNNIRILPDTLGGLESLQTLDIRWNNMACELPPSFSNLRSLIHFKFNGNKIPNISRYFKEVLLRRYKSESSSESENSYKPSLNSKFKPNTKVYSQLNTNTATRNKYNRNTDMGKNTNRNSTNTSMSTNSTNMGTSTDMISNTNNRSNLLNFQQPNLQNQNVTQVFNQGSNNSQVRTELLNIAQPFDINFNQQPLQYPIQVNTVPIYNPDINQHQNHTVVPCPVQPIPHYILPVPLNTVLGYNIQPTEYKIQPYSPLPQQNYNFVGDPRAVMISPPYNQPPFPVSLHPQIQAPVGPYQTLMHNVVLPNNQLYYQNSGAEIPSNPQIYFGYPQQ